MGGLSISLLEQRFLFGLSCLRKAASEYVFHGSCAALICSALSFLHSLAYVMHVMVTLDGCDGCLELRPGDLRYAK